MTITAGKGRVQAVAVPAGSGACRFAEYFWCVMRRTRGLICGKDVINGSTTSLVSTVLCGFVTAFLDGRGGGGLVVGGGGRRGGEA